MDKTEKELSDLLGKLYRDNPEFEAAIEEIAILLARAIDELRRRFDAA